MNGSKIHPKLTEALDAEPLAAADARAIGEEIKYPVIVQMSPTRSDGIAVADTSELPLAIEKSLPSISAVAGNATRDEIAALSQNEAVDQVWLDEHVFIKLDQCINLLEITSVWESENEGNGIRICILDTGVDATHPDLQGRVVAQQDFTGEGNADGNGHGTHVAGIVAGDGTGSNGRFRGVAPRALLLAGKVLRNSGSGSMSDIIAGIEWAEDEGAQVLNLSFGTSSSSDGTDPLSRACNNAMARGMVVCVAAGNEGPDAQSIGAPGAAEAVITVGASTFNDGIADFSSRGPTLDGRSKPDFVLPGHRIASLQSSTAPVARPIDLIDGHAQYSRKDGTSMATPIASGIVALMLFANPTLRPMDVKAILKATALQLNVNAHQQGAGRVRGAAALAEALNFVVEAATPV